MTNIEQLYQDIHATIDHSGNGFLIEKEDPFSDVVLEDEYIVYPIEGISTYHMHKHPYLTFDVELTGIDVTRLFEQVGLHRKILPDEMTITVDGNIWYVTKGEYDFEYSFHSDEEVRVTGEINVYDVEEAE